MFNYNIILSNYLKQLHFYISHNNCYIMYLKHTFTFKITHRYLNILFLIKYSQLMKNMIESTIFHLLRIQLELYFPVVASNQNHNTFMVKNRIACLYSRKS